MDNAAGSTSYRDREGVAKGGKNLEDVLPRRSRGKAPPREREGAEGGGGLEWQWC